MTTKQAKLPYMQRAIQSQFFNGDIFFISLLKNTNQILLYQYYKNITISWLHNIMR